MNMTFLLTVAYGALRAAVGSGLFERIGAKVVEMIDKDIPGDEKKELVKQFVLDEAYAFVGRFGSGWKVALDLVIAIVRWRFEVSEPKKT
jgi:hypothetical protein